MIPLKPVLTNVGLAAVLNAQHTGVNATLTHITFGDAGLANHNPIPGYEPDSDLVDLRRRRATTMVAGGSRVTPTEIEVQALYDDNKSYWIREIGFIIDGENDSDNRYIEGTGTVIAIWSSPDNIYRYKTAGEPIAIAYYLALVGIPPNSVEVNITGPTINLTMVAPIALLSAEILRLQRRAIQSEIVRVTPIIESTWR